MTKVGGVGLVKLGAWLAERHDAYIAFMIRIQNMIVAITKAEKEERQRRHTIRKATIGYDTNKYLKTDIRIRDERNLQVQYEELKIAPPAAGRHRFTHCQKLYRDVHNFHSLRTWAPAKETQQIS